MDATVPTKKPLAFNPWLPYWAVFQADVHQTFRSWVYRIWVALAVAAVAGFLLYRVGLTHEAGLIQQVSLLFSNLLQAVVLGSVAFVVALSAGSISSDRGALADSVLSRGISRRSYYLGKWHARLAAVLGAYFILSTAALAGSMAIMREDVTLDGCLVGLLTVGAVLGFVVSAGVAVSAMANNTLLAVSMLWVALYGGGLALTSLRKVLPPGILAVTPDQVLTRLPHILCGEYDLPALSGLAGWCAAASVGLSLVGMICFSRRDV
jgi:ABC-type transport system involved in multi-copper enzyme maturation permease subunit